jgi:hypothetical protein
LGNSAAFENWFGMSVDVRRNTAMVAALGREKAGFNLSLAN